MKEDNVVRSGALVGDDHVELEGVLVYLARLGRGSRLL